MNRKIISFFVVLVILVSLSACGKSESTDIFCSECNSTVAEGSKFCSSCGAEVNTGAGKTINLESAVVENDIKFIKKIFECQEIETLAMHYPEDITSYDDLTIESSFADVKGYYEVVLLDNGDIMRVIFRWDKGNANISAKDMASTVIGILEKDSDLDLAYYSDEELWFELADNSDNNEDEIETSGRTYNWLDVCVNPYLPKPKSEFGVVQGNYPESLYMIVEGTSYQAFEDYVDSCVAMGYNIDVVDSNGEYEAFSEYTGRLYLHYDSYSKAMTVSLDILVSGSYRWHELYFAGLLPAPVSTKGNVHNNNDARCDLYVGEVSKSDFDNYVEECKERGFTYDSLEYENYYFAKHSNGYELTLEYYGCDVIYIEIYDPYWESREDELGDANIDIRPSSNVTSSIEEDEQEDNETVNSDSDVIGVPISVFIDRYNKGVDYYNELAQLSGQKSIIHVTAKDLTRSDDVCPNGELTVSLNPNTTHKDVIGIINIYCEDIDALDYTKAIGEILAMIYAFDESITPEEAFVMVGTLLEETDYEENGIVYNNYSFGGLLVLKGSYEGFEIIK